MPIAPTYPGVYIQEIPSGVRTITGVSTSVTAFVGRAQRGPVNDPVVVNSFGEFERVFGGLWLPSALSFAVRDFFLNGGSQAIIVRLFHDRDAGGTPIGNAFAKLTVGPVALRAANPGSWGANLRVSIDVNVARETAQALGVDPGQLFNLTVQDTAGRTESIRNITLRDSPRRIDQVLAAESTLVRWDGSDPPVASGAPVPLINAPVPDELSAAQAALDALPGLLATATRTQGQAQTALDALNRANPPAAQADIMAAQDALQAAQKALSDLNDSRGPLETRRSDAMAALAASDGGNLTMVNDFNPPGAEDGKRGLFALENTDLFNLLCVPPYTATGNIEQPLISIATAYCERRRAVLLLDPPTEWGSRADVVQGVAAFIGTPSPNAALFFPRLRAPNPLLGNRVEDFAPSGAVAGVISRIDSQRGVWKAPAGLEATLAGVPQLSVPLTDAENGALNQLGVNCLRTLPAAGRVVWGSRTLQGNDSLASEWKYIPVRRLALYLEESLFRGTQWVVFEPNDEPLWSQIRLNIGAFMQNLFRQGAFQGRTPQEAYFVKCDKETTTQADINLGIVRIVVGFAPLKPAEFVILQFQQLAGQLAA